MANPARLVARTRVRRAEYSVLGSSSVSLSGNSVEENEIFDDSDFYHQLLREFIDRKTAGSGEAGQVGLLCPLVSSVMSLWCDVLTVAICTQ